MLYESLRHYLDVMTTNMSQSGKITRPLGNQHHGMTAFRPAQISCYKAQLELDSKYFAAVSPVTGILKRFMI